MTTTKPAPTRPFTLPFGLLFGRTLRVYFRSLVPLTLIGALVLSPWIVLILLGPEFMDPSSPAIRGQSPGALLAFGLANIVLPGLLGLILTGALSKGVFVSYCRQRVGLWLALSKGLQNIRRSLGTGLLVALRLFLFALPAAVPIFGIPAGSVPESIRMALALVLLLPAITEYLRLCMALPAAIAEGLGGGRAVQRSLALTSGSKWRIAGGMIAVGLFLCALGILLAFVLQLLAERSPVDPRLTVTVVMILGQCLFATMGVVCYLWLRLYKENVDPVRLLEIFD